MSTCIFCVPSARQLMTVVTSAHFNVNAPLLFDVCPLSRSRFLLCNNCGDTVHTHTKLLLYWLGAALRTPPEGGVRAKKFFITFDTNFGHYLPRGTKFDGSQKCRIGAFCTIAKNSGEMPKKRLKNRPKWCQIFFEPSHMLKNNICGNFLFSICFILVLYRSSFLNNFLEISPENRVI